MRNGGARRCPVAAQVREYFVYVGILKKVIFTGNDKYHIISLYRR